MLKEVYIVIAFIVFGTACFAQQGVRNANNTNPLAPQVKLKSPENKSLDEMYLQNNPSTINQTKRKAETNASLMQNNNTSYHGLAVANLPALTKADSIRIQEMIEFKEKERVKNGTKPEIKE